MSIDEKGRDTLTVSWSRLYEFSKCQQKVALRMQGKGERLKDGRRFIHGIIADRAMRKWLDQDTEHLPGQMSAYVDELWDELAEHNDEYKIQWKGDPSEDKATVRALAKRVVENVEPFLFNRVLPYEFEPEKRFRVPMRVPDLDGSRRTIELIGGIDIAVREADKVFSLYDLKATTNERYVTGGILPQLIFYHIAWELMFDTESIRTAFLTPACKKTYHELNIDADAKRHLLTRIVRYAQHVWSGEAPLLTKDLHECFFCDVKRSCPRFATPSVETNGHHKVSFKTVVDLRNKAEELEEQ